jgi:tRNA-dihydrouridine synthase
MPDYALAAELVETLPAPVILSGGMSDEDAIRTAFDQTGAEAVMLARGSLGMPWRFERLLGRRSGEPTRAEVGGELAWVIDRAEEHLGVERAGRYLRKFYPWYADALGLSKRERQALVTAETTDDARAAIGELMAAEAAPAAA